MNIVRPGVLPLGPPGDPPVLLIDLDGTIVDYAATERRALRAVHAQLGGERLTFEEFRAAFESVNDGLWDAYRRGEVELDHLRVERFTRLADGRMPAERAAACFEAALARNVALYPDSRPALARLASFARLVLVTDGIAGVQRAKLARAGITGYFEEIVISAEAGHRKPEPELLWYAVGLVAAKPESSLMVGDSWVSDGWGAQAAGVSFCWVRRGAQRPAGQPPAHLEVGDLADLAAILCPSAGRIRQRPPRRAGLDLSPTGCLDFAAVPNRDTPLDPSEEGSPE